MRRLEQVHYVISITTLCTSTKAMMIAALRGRCTQRWYRLQVRVAQDSKSLPLHPDGVTVSRRFFFTEKNDLKFFLHLEGFDFFFCNSRKEKIFLKLEGLKIFLQLEKGKKIFFVNREKKIFFLQLGKDLKKIFLQL